MIEGDSCIKSPNPNRGKDFTSPLKMGPTALKRREIVEDSCCSARDYSSMENLHSFRCTPLKATKVVQLPFYKRNFWEVEE